MSLDESHRQASVDHEADLRIAPLWRLASRRMSAIVMLNRGGAGGPFYCVHPIAGDVAKLYELAQLVGSEQCFYGIQVPREKMTAAFGASIAAIAQYYVESLVAIQPNGSILLGGWSVGAIIALEMAQQLRAIGRNVPLLVAIDGAPCNTGGGINLWNPRYVWRLICNLPHWLRDNHQATRSFPAFIQLVGKKLAFRAVVNMPTLGRPQTLNDEAVLDVIDNNGWSSDQRSFIRALYAAVRDYVPKPYAGRVVVYEARIQPLWHLLQVGAAWSKIAAQTEIVVLESGHASLLQEPAIGVLAAHLRARLATLRAETEAATAEIHREPVINGMREGAVG